jgi:hypothetical protein
VQEANRQRAAALIDPSRAADTVDTAGITAHTSGHYPSPGRASAAIPVTGTDWASAMTTTRPGLTGPGASQTTIGSTSPDGEHSPNGV